MPDVKQLKPLLNAQAARIAQHLLPAGKRVSRTWKVGSVENEPGQSLSIVLEGDSAGTWKDFSTDERGDIIALWQRARKVDFKTALNEAASFIGYTEAPGFTKVFGSQKSKWGACQLETGSRQPCCIRIFNERSFAAP